MLCIGRAPRRVHIGRRQHLVDAVQRIPLPPQIHADGDRQLGRIRAQNRNQRGRRRALRLLPRERLRCAKALGAVALLERGKLRFARLPGQRRRLLGQHLGLHLLAHIGQLLDRGRPILHRTCRHQRGRPDLHGLRIAMVLGHVVDEQRLEHLLIIDRAVAQGRIRHARDRVGRLDLQLEFVGDRLQAVGLVLHPVGESIGQLGVLLVGQLRAHLALQLRLDGVQRLHATALHVFQLDDVKAEIALHHIADIARLLERKQCILERRHGRTLGEEAQLTALRGRARIPRILLGELSETARALAHFGQHLFRALLGRVLVGGLGVVRQLDQDVRGAALLFGLEARGVLIVVLLELLGRDGDLLHHLLARKHHVLGLDLLGHRELLLVRVVVSLDRLVVDRDLGRVVGRLEQQRLHFTLLVTRLDQAIHQRLGHEGTRNDRLRNLLQHEFRAHARIELIRRHALGGQQLDVGLGIELAVRLAQLRDRGDLLDGLADLAVRHRQIGARRLIDHHALLDDAVQHVAAHLRTLELARIVLRAQHLAQTLGLLADARIELTGGNGGVTHLGSIVRAIHEARVALHTKEHERRKHQNQQHQKHQAPMRTYEIKHAGPDEEKMENPAILSGAAGLPENLAAMRRHGGTIQCGRKDKGPNASGL
uniref:Uncharacterized protein n=2 Tax=Ralstonia solanacearum species complex TaxID=3116862 RepID=A0A0S4TMP7_RALSL|nr:conserved protein of unknown function [Ralstonia solanacearum]